MPVVDLEQENQVRCQGSIWIDDSTSWIILARIFSTFSTGVYIIQFLIRVQSAFRGMQIHFLCHVNFGNFFVYVYCTSEMCTAFEVLEVNISNQNKRWIKIYKKNFQFTFCSMELFTTWHILPIVYSNNMVNFCP